MGITAIIKLFLTLASAMAEFAKTKRLMDAGAAEAVLKGVRDADDAINRANIARANADKLPSDNDPNNRDNAN
jgi:hypothetical protein